MMKNTFDFQLKLKRSNGINMRKAKEVKMIRVTNRIQMMTRKKQRRRKRRIRKRKRSLRKLNIIPSEHLDLLIGIRFNELVVVAVKAATRKMNQKKVRSMMKKQKGNHVLIQAKYQKLKIIF